MYHSFDLELLSIAISCCRISCETSLLWGLLYLHNNLKQTVQLLVSLTIQSHQTLWLVNCGHLAPMPLYIYGIETIKFRFQNIPIDLYQILASLHDSLEYCQHYSLAFPHLSLLRTLSFRDNTVISRVIQCTYKCFTLHTTVQA